MSDQDDIVISEPIMQSSVVHETSCVTKKILMSVCVVVIIVLICYMMQQQEPYRDNPVNYPIDTNEPEFVLPHDGKTAKEIKPEEIVALWDDLSVVKNFEYAGGKGLFEDRNTVLKEAPEEDLLWAQVHSAP